MNTDALRERSPVDCDPLSRSDGEGPANRGQNANPAAFSRDAGVSLMLSLACDLDSVRERAVAARRFLSQQGVSEDDLIACELALVEGLNNAILYVEGPRRELPIEVQIGCNRLVIEIQVVDHTRGFEWPAELRLPKAEEEHGRG